MWGASGRSRWISRTGLPLARRTRAMSTSMNTESPYRSDSGTNTRARSLSVSWPFLPSSPVRALTIQTVLTLFAIDDQRTRVAFPCGDNRHVFVDQVKLVARGGKGGAGSASMRREPYSPHGGPDGGDGGKGGDVVVRVDPSMFDLGAYRDRPHQRAKDGGPGGKNNRHGADGA